MKFDERIEDQGVDLPALDLGCHLVEDVLVDDQLFTLLLGKFEGRHLRVEFA